MVESYHFVIVSFRIAGCDLYLGYQLTGPDYKDELRAVPTAWLNESTIYRTTVRPIL